MPEPALPYADDQQQDHTRISRAWAAQRDQGNFTRIWAACILWDKESNCYFALESVGLAGSPVCDMMQFQHHSQFGPLFHKTMQARLDEGYSEIKDWRAPHWGILQSFAERHPYFLTLIAPEEAAQMDTEISVVAHKALHCTEPQNGKPRDAVWCIFWLKDNEPTTTHWIIRAWGRRGSKLSVSEEKYALNWDAKVKYNDLLGEKLSKGYKEVWWRDPQFRIPEALLPLNPIFSTYLTHQDKSTMPNPATKLPHIMLKEPNTIPYQSKHGSNGPAPKMQKAPNPKIAMLQEDSAGLKAGQIIMQDPITGLWAPYSEKDGKSKENAWVSLPPSAQKIVADDDDDPVDQLIRISAVIGHSGFVMAGMKHKSQAAAERDGQALAAAKSLAQIHKEQDNHLSQKIPLGQGQLLREGDIICKSISGERIGKIIKLLPWRSDCNVGIVGDSRQSRCMAEASGRVHVSGIDAAFSLLRELPWLDGGWNELEL